MPSSDGADSQGPSFAFAFDFSDFSPNASLASVATFSLSAAVCPSRSATRTWRILFSAASRSASARQNAASLSLAMNTSKHDFGSCVQPPRSAASYGFTEYLQVDKGEVDDDLLRDMT